ncbi:hypothetical protein [Sinomonas terrae]|uniref:Uncharacterized protein n=1 Tax=Sinomonas terrae TaxID=2908838 RepID=A0ABS9TWJ1_9MICC|nr:hypothetical protein [Sinomonas terrae]MCH6468758.1 hypothetical protein [Sinomonas terrae]
MNISRRTLLPAAAFTASAALALTATPAFAAPAPAQPASAFTVKAFPAQSGESVPDDITRLGDSIYVAYQNGVGPMGEASTSGATASTIQQYSLDGKPGGTWSIPGRIDGMGADAAGHRLLVTTNEDGNSSFHTVTPEEGARGVSDFSYSGITHGGGTDAVTIYEGKIFVSASNPADSTGPAVYEVTLSGSTAALTPVFADDAKAVLANGPQAGTSTALALTDPDSSTVVPPQSARFANDFLLDSQGDQQLVFAKHSGTPQEQLQVLNLTSPVDDTAFATQSHRELWITDPDHNTVYAVDGDFRSGEAITSVTPDTGADYLASVNLSDGSLTPIPQLAEIHPKGLLFTASR